MKKLRLLIITTLIFSIISCNGLKNEYILDITNYQNHIEISINQDKELNFFAIIIQKNKKEEIVINDLTFKIESNEINSSDKIYSMDINTFKDKIYLEIDHLTHSLASIKVEVQTLNGTIKTNKIIDGYNSLNNNESLSQEVLINEINEKINRYDQSIFEIKYILNASSNGKNITDRFSLGVDQKESYLHLKKSNEPTILIHKEKDYFTLANVYESNGVTYYQKHKILEKNDLFDFDGSHPLGFETTSNDKSSLSMILSNSDLKDIFRIDLSKFKISKHEAYYLLELDLNDLIKNIDELQSISNETSQVKVLFKLVFNENKISITTEYNNFEYSLNMSIEVNFDNINKINIDDLQIIGDTSLSDNIKVFEMDKKYMNALLPKTNAYYKFNVDSGIYYLNIEKIYEYKISLYDANTLVKFDIDYVDLYKLQGNAYVFNLNQGSYILEFSNQTSSMMNYNFALERLDEKIDIPNFNEPTINNEMNFTLDFSHKLQVYSFLITTENYSLFDISIEALHEPNLFVYKDGKMNKLSLKRITLNQYQMNLDKGENLIFIQTNFTGKLTFDIDLVASVPSVIYDLKDEVPYVYSGGKEVFKIETNHMLLMKYYIKDLSLYHASYDVNIKHIGLDEKSNLQKFYYYQDSLLEFIVYPGTTYFSFDTNEMVKMEVVSIEEYNFKATEIIELETMPDINEFQNTERVVFIGEKKVLEFTLDELSQIYIQYYIGDHMHLRLKSNDLDIRLTNGIIQLPKGTYFIESTNLTEKSEVSYQLAISLVTDINVLNDDKPYNPYQIEELKMGDNLQVKSDYKNDKEYYILNITSIKKLTMLSNYKITALIYDMDFVYLGGIEDEVSYELKPGSYIVILSYRNYIKNETVTFKIK